MGMRVFPDGLPPESFLLPRVVGGVKGVLQRDEVFAGFELIEQFLFFLELLVAVGRRLDREADAPVAFVNLDHTRRHFLPDLEHILILSTRSSLTWEMWTSPSMSF